MGDRASAEETCPAACSGLDGSRLVLLVRDPASLYAYWELAEEQPGASSWAVRLHDAEAMHPAALVEYACELGAGSGYLPDVASGRVYRLELGYYDDRQRWHSRLFSNVARTPPFGPSRWVANHFVTVRWRENLASVALPDALRQPPANDGEGAGCGKSTAPPISPLFRRPLPGMAPQPPAASARSEAAAVAPFSAPKPRQGGQLPSLARFAPIRELPEIDDGRPPSATPGSRVRRR